MTQRVLGPSGSKRRKTRLLVLAGLMAAVFAVFFVTASSANLPSSGAFQFEDNDGNLAATGSNFDWNGPTPEPISCTGTISNCGLDEVGTTTDNSLGQGSKEDDLTPTVVDGSIPPQKDDLSRFYVNKQKVAGHTYLYMAWERSNLLGSAHMDFEFNQAPVGVTATSVGAVTLNRKAGDLLIDFDFGGSGTPVLALHRWITTGTASTDCEASNTLPCWNKGVTLAPSVAEAQVNSAPVTDTNPPGAPRTLDGSTKTTGSGANAKTTISSTFGEAGIDLTAANVFPANKCFHLGDAWLKSRSSGESFTSELKDFVAPIPINISNCGEIKIIKRSAPTRGIDKNFDFTSDIPNTTDNPPTVDSQPYCQADTSPSAFTLNDKDANVTPPAAPHDSAGNTEDCVNVLSADSSGNAITYHVIESGPPAGWVLKSLTCTKSPANGSSTGVQDGTNPNQANITVAPGETVTCVYLDELQLGAIKIIKTSSKAAATPLSGAHFKVCTNATGTCVPAKTGSDDLVTAGTSGSVCIDGLSFGDYYVTETQAPNGYAADDTSTKTVTVDNNAKCSDATYVGESKTFTDTPLTKLVITVSSKASGGTASSIKCVNKAPADFATGTDIGDSPKPASGFADPVTVTADGTTALTPGTYTCKVVIDP